MKLLLYFCYKSWLILFFPPEFLSLSFSKICSSNSHAFPLFLFIALSSCSLLYSFLVIGGPLNFYNGQSLCLHFGMTAGSFKDQYINPEGFASFLALLESIPLHNSDSNYRSFEYSMPDLRYIILSYFSTQLMTFFY